MATQNPDPLDILCYRPTDFQSKQKQMETLKQGLEEARRMDLSSDNKNILLIA